MTKRDFTAFRKLSAVFEEYDFFNDDAAVSLEYEVLCDVFNALPSDIANVLRDYHSQRISKVNQLVLEEEIRYSHKFDF